MIRGSLVRGLSIGMLALGSGCGWFAAPTDDAAEPAPTPPEPNGMAEMAEKKAVQMPTDGRLDKVDWDKAFERNRVAERFVTEDVQRAVEKSGVPILLPSTESLLENLAIYAGEGWYTATVSDADHQILIRGTRHAHSVDLDDKTKAAMGAPADLVLTRTEGIWTGSFSEYGAAYNLEIECPKGPNAPACKDDETIRAYVKKLALVGVRP